LLSHTIALESDIEPEPLRKIVGHDIDDTETVIHVVNIHDFDVPEDDIKPPQTTRLSKKLLLTLLFSVVLHALAFYIISLRIQLPTLSEEAKLPVIVQAKLYRPPPVPTVEKAPVEATPVESVALPEVAIPQVQSDTPPVQGTEEVVVTEETQPNNIEIPVIEPEITTNQAAEPVIEPPTTPAPPIKPRSIYSNKAATDLRALERQKRNSMASQAFREFQYNKTHPEIKTQPKTPLQLSANERRQIADEQRQKDAQISVDCKKRGAKALSFISGIAGGTVKCNKNPELQSFIKKRVNRSATEQNK
jgi:hypothetical protein